MDKYKYLFSVVVPIYNVEEYLEECIESIVNQTIGFENIQLILINDGSLDNSDYICLNYKSKYPYNIVYEKKENGGLPSARNTGYKYIEGKYVNFLDSDDKFEFDTFEKVFNYFEFNYKEINLVIISVKHFEAKTGVSLMYKEFNKTCLVDIRIDSNRKQNSVCNCFFKQELILKYYFDEECKFAEDFKLISSILINELKYGYLADTFYLYRVRNKNDSMTNTLDTNNIYIDYINKHFINSILKYLLDICIKSFGYVIDYIQKNILLNTHAFCIKETLPKTEEVIFLSNIHEVMQYIDDRIIIDIFYKNYEKLFFLQIKHKNFNNRIEKLDINFLVNKGYLSSGVLPLNEYMDLLIEQEDITIFESNNKNILNVKGYVSIPIENIILNKIYLKVEDEYFLALITDIKMIKIWNKEFSCKYMFTINLEYEKCKNKKIEFYLDINGIIEFYPKIINID